MVSRRAIKRFADEVARRFKPEKIILFGSYAYGQPTPDSDVDLLVVMPYARSRDTLMEEYEKIQSPENIAALMAPRDDRAMFMQRMEDSNLRQLWRLTSILVKVRKGTLE